MERFISGEYKILQNQFPTDSSLVWRSMENMFGSKEEQKRDSSTVLMLQEQLFLSELFREVKVRAKDRQHSFCPLILCTKMTKIPKRLTWMYRVMHNTCTQHGKDINQDVVYWVDINLTIEKRLELCQTRSNAIILHETLPAYCMSNIVIVKKKTEELSYEKVYMSPRPPSKISLKHEWKRELGTLNVQKLCNNLNVPLLQPKRPVLRRSMLLHFAKNLILENERDDLIRNPFWENP